jgi:glycosyltransferase involved in cell wall biosynthesis
MYISHQLSIIVRTIDSRKEKLVRCLNSLATSEYPLECVQVVIVYQGLNNEYFDEIQKISTRYPSLNFKLIQNPSIQDERAKNINIGIEASTGQYLAFLDDDDEILTNHYSDLITLIKNTNSVWAYSNTILKKYNFEKKKFSENKYVFHWETFNYSIFSLKNFIPIHSFLLDRLRLDESKVVLKTDERLSHYEDYYLLLKLAYHYKPAHLNKYTAIYYIDNSNTGVHESTEKENNTKYIQSKKIIEELKMELSVFPYWIDEMIDYHQSFFKIKIPFIKKIFLIRLSSSHS